MPIGNGINIVLNTIVITNMVQKKVNATAK